MLNETGRAIIKTPKPPKGGFETLRLFRRIVIVKKIKRKNSLCNIDCAFNSLHRGWGLVFPLQRFLLYNVNKAAEKETHKHKYCPKTAPTQLSEVNSVGIEKDHFHIKQNK